MNGFYVNCSCVDECRNRVVDFYCTLIICGWEYAGYLNIWRLPLHNTTGIMRFWKWQLFWASKAYKRKVLEVCFWASKAYKSKVLEVSCETNFFRWLWQKSDRLDNSKCQCCKITGDLLSLSFKDVQTVSIEMIIAV